MSNPDLDVEDVMAVAQRSLQKANALERDIEELQDECDELLDRVVQVELRTSEWTDRIAGLSWSIEHASPSVFCIAERGVLWEEY